MSKLPDDIIVEILSWLPAKSLIRFKCVCKSWNTLISDPNFAKLQLKHNKTRNSQRIFLSTWPPYSVDFEAYNGADHDGEQKTYTIRELQYPPAIKGSDPYVVIRGSCDGIICLLDSERNIFLWNPTSGDYKELPKPIDPVFGMFCYGFGYNSRLDDYQVIRGTKNYMPENGSEEITFQLYSVRTNEWKIVSSSNWASFSVEGVGTYWNGTLHWLTTKESDPSGSKGEYAIVSFDFEDEKFKELLSLPNQYDPTMYYSLDLGFSGNRLCVFCALDETFFEAYEVKENHENESKTCWSLLFKDAHDGFPGYSNKAMCLRKNGEVVFDFDGYQLALYKANQVIEYLNIYTNWDWDSGLYLESLVSPNYCLLE